MLCSQGSQEKSDLINDKLLDFKNQFIGNYNEIYNSNKEKEKKMKFNVNFNDLIFENIEKFLELKEVDVDYRTIADELIKFLNLPESLKAKNIVLIHVSQEINEVLSSTNISYYKNDYIKKVTNKESFAFNLDAENKNIFKINKENFFSEYFKFGLFCQPYNNLYYFLQNHDEWEIVFAIQKKDLEDENWKSFFFNEEQYLIKFKELGYSLDSNRL